MDKQSQNLLEQAQGTMGRQTDEIKKLREQVLDLSILKMAYDVSTVMLAKEQIPDSDFQDTVENLKQRPLEDLQKRAEVLSVLDPTKDLVLGGMDDRNEGPEKNSSTPGSQTSERDYSAQATDAGRHLIETFSQ